MKKILFPLMFTSVLFAQDYGLVITSSYEDRPASSLPGTKVDAQNASKVASIFGFNLSSNNTTYLINAQASKEAIFKELDNIAQKVSSNDKVFIYYSGHGSSGYYKDKCESSLYPDDGKDIYTTELNTLLKQKYKKPNAVVVFLDACHSGDFPTSITSKSRTMAKRSSTLKPKVFAKTGAGQCKPSHNNPDSITYMYKSVRSIGNEEMLKNNLLIISASRDSEVSWDNPEMGGVATNAILECSTTNNQSNPHDKIAIQELIGCAQQKIDNKFSIDPTKIQHIVFDGIPTTPTSTNKASSFVTDIMNHPEKIYPLKVVAKDVISPNQSANAEITSPIDGYLTVLDVDMKNDKITNFYTNLPITKNVPKALPAIVGAEVGKTTLIAIVTSTPTKDIESLMKNRVVSKGSTRALRVDSKNPNLHPYGAGYIEVLVQ
jgi:hypothetical protein